MNMLLFQPSIETQKTIIENSQQLQQVPINEAVPYLIATGIILGLYYLVKNELHKIH